MYDQVIYDEPERILSILARVEGEEERKARLERESLESRAPGTPHDGSQPPPPSIVTEPSSSHPPDLSDRPQSATVAKKEKKRKREGPGQQAKNMSEDARARQSNQTAMRSVGGRSKYSWLSGGVTSAPVATAPAPTAAIMASLPAPKFAPRPGAAKVTSGGTNKQTMMPNNGGSRKEGGRLGGLIPAAHLAVQETRSVVLRDSLFALERERGSGAGRGSGSRVLFKTYVKGAKE